MGLHPHCHIDIITNLLLSSQMEHKKTNFLLCFCCNKIFFLVRKSLCGETYVDRRGTLAELTGIDRINSEK